jgi:hypothetical protein
VNGKERQAYAGRKRRRPLDGNSGCDAAKPGRFPQNQRSQGEQSPP